MAYFEMAKTTFLNLFRKPATLMYPVKKRNFPAATRGHITMNVETCIFCGICQKRCPTEAITVVKAEKTWRIEHLRCIACGSCTEACPKACLEMANQYRPPVDRAGREGLTETRRSV